MVEGGKKLLNPLVAAQNFEYKISNIWGEFIPTSECVLFFTLCRQTSHLKAVSANRLKLTDYSTFSLLKPRLRACRTVTHTICKTMRLGMAVREPLTAVDRNFVCTAPTFACLYRRQVYVPNGRKNDVRNNVSSSRASR